MNMKILAVAVIAVVIIAGCAVVLTRDSGSDDKKGSDTPDTPDDPINEDLSSYMGLVYGNSNGDCVIDSSDITIMNEIMDGTKKLYDYPLADSNRDGTVTSDDVQIVKDFMAGKSTTLWVKDTTDHYVSVKYPLQGIFTNGGTNMRVLVQVLGIEDKLVANGTNEYISPVLDKTLYDAKKSGTVKEVTTGATTADFNELIKLSFSAAILEDSGMTGYTDDNARSVWKSWGVDVMQFSVDGYDVLEKSIATVGILTGTEVNAQKFIDMLDGTVKTIKDTLGDKMGTTTVMDVVMSNSVSGKSADYYNATILAGGNNLADWEESVRKFDPKADQWLFEEKYNPQYLIHIKSMTYGDEPSKSDISSYKGYFDKTQAYKDGNYYLMNGTVPYPVRLALMATIMYPDQFDSDWAYEIFQDYFDAFSGYNDGKTSGDAGYWNVRDYKILWTTEELNELLG